MEVVGDFFSVENFGRASTAAALGYVSAPIVLPNIDSVPMPGFSWIPFVGGGDMSVSGVLGTAAFASTFVIDGLNKMLYGSYSPGARLTRFPSMMMHTVGGGLTYLTIVSMGIDGITSPNPFSLGSSVNKQIFAAGAGIDIQTVARQHVKGAAADGAEAADANTNGVQMEFLWCGSKVGSASA